MKSIKILSYIFSAALLATGLSSCDKVDYPDRFRPTKGVPTIHSIRYADKDIQIDKAFMEETVCLLGENLRSINQIWFNDQKAILNTSYMTDNTLLVQVPKTMPVVETDKIYMITAQKDTVTYDFSVLPPAPRVLEMSYEYAEPGQKVLIIGDYFYQKEGKPMVVEFPNAVVEDFEILSLRLIEVTVPEGAQPGRVKVTTDSGVASSNFMYKDNRGLLFDFDGTNGLYTINKGWHATPIAEGIGVGGSNCLMMDGSSESFSCDGGDWHDGTCHFEYWAGNWQDPETYGTWDGRRLIDIVDFSDFANMALKFEMKIDEANPWTGCPMQIIFSDVTLVSNGSAGVKDIYGNVLGGCNNTYFNDASISLPRYFFRPWADPASPAGSGHTNGKWVTVTVPISQFTQFWDDTAATGKLTPASFSNLEFFFAGGTKSEGEPCSPIVYIDNIRAVPAK